MASVRAASFASASLAAAPVAAETSSGPELPPHAQPRVCVRKPTQENGVKRAAPVGTESQDSTASQEEHREATDRLPRAPDMLHTAPAEDSARPTTGTAIGPASPGTTGSPLPSSSGQNRVPFGYVPGAISVELPKRQRSLKHGSAGVGMPRSYSSLI